MNGKSGKLVAPAVALMLCVVALIGVGFAISLQSTSTANNNEVVVNGLVLDLTGDGDNKTTLTGTAAVYYETVQNSVGGGITFNFDESEMIIAKGNVSIKAPGDVSLTYTVSNVKVVLANGNEATIPSGIKLKMGTEVKTASDGYTFTKNVSLNGDGAVKTGSESFTIYLDATTSTTISGATADNLPAKITYKLEVSAAYPTA